MQKPNTKLYTLLLSISVVLVILLFVFLIINIDNEKFTIVISCLISIIGGGFASIVVSWLIDIASCKRYNSSMLLRKIKCIEYIYMYTDDLFQSIADSCSIIETEKPKTWDLWLRLLEEHKYFRNAPNFHDQLLGVYVYLNMLIGVIDELNSGELKEYCMHDSQELVTELSIFGDALQRLRNKIFVDSDENINHIIFCINDFLSTILQFNKYLTKEYSTS